MATVVINNPKDLEKYRKDITRTYWNGEEFEFEQYEQMSDNCKMIWDEMLEEYKEGIYSATMKNSLWTENKYASTNKFLNAVNSLVDSNGKDVWGLKFNNFNLKNYTPKELKVIVSETVKRMNELGTDFGYDELVPTNKLDDLVFALQAKQKLNKYQTKPQRYYEFFGDPNAKYEAGIKYSTQDPSDNTLIVKCDLDLDDAILDVYGNLEATDINCGFLGVNGKIKARNISCDSLYAEALTVNSLECIENRGVHYYPIEEMTINEKFAGAFVYGNNPKKFFESPLKNNNLMIGKLLIRDKAEQETLKVRINGEVHSFKLDQHLEFIGGEVKANSIKTENAFIGEANIKSFNCSGYVLCGDDVVNKNISTYSKAQRKALVDILMAKENKGKIPVIKAEQFAINTYKNLNSSIAWVNSLEAYNINAEELISEDYISANNITANGITFANLWAGENVEASSVYGKNLTCKSLEADKLSVENKIKVENAVINKRMFLPDDVEEISGKFKLANVNLEANKDEVGKVRNLEILDQKLEQENIQKPRPVSSVKKDIKIGKSGLGD